MFLFFRHLLHNQNNGMQEGKGISHARVFLLNGMDLLLF